MADFIYAGDGGVFNTCTRCNETKPISEFSKDKRRGIGYAATCSICNSRLAREWAEKNPEKARGWYKSLTDEGRAEVQRRRREKRLSNPEELEKSRERARNYYAKNREKVLARMSSDEGREYSRNKMRERMKDDSLRLHSNISRAIRASIKDKARRPWESLVGYSLEELMNHLERQFLPGMTWENHGKGKGRWHIDHIIPRAEHKYDSAVDPDFKACWALTNLRPLWSEQNISKHSKRLYLL